MSWWKFWKKNKFDHSDNPRLILELTPNQTIHIIANWPHTSNEEGLKKLASDFALFTYVVNSGRLLPTCEQAIVYTGQNCNMSGLAEDIIRNINSLISMNNSTTKKSGPMIQPKEVFEVKNHE